MDEKLTVESSQSSRNSRSGAASRQPSYIIITPLDPPQAYSAAAGHCAAACLSRNSVTDGCHSARLRQLVGLLLFRPSRPQVHCGCHTAHNPGSRHCRSSAQTSRSIQHLHTTSFVESVSIQATPAAAGAAATAALQLAAMSELDHVRTLHLVQQRKRDCLNSAVLDGLTSAGISLAVAGGLSWSLQKSSPVSACGAGISVCVWGWGGEA
jgi:hypothetical protein